jgi:hypothetical protein
VQKLGGSEPDATAAPVAAPKTKHAPTAKAKPVKAVYREAEIKGVLEQAFFLVSYDALIQKIINKGHSRIVWK